MKIPSGNQLLDPHQILETELALGEGDQLADLGCGSAGFFSLQAAKLVGDKGVVYAVDVLKDSLASVETRAKSENLSNLKILWSNLEKFGSVKINDQSLDHALLINVLFQNKDLETMVKEATRLLKHAGKLLIIDWAPGRFPVGPSQESKVDPEKIKSLALQLGLTELKSFSAGKYHFGLIFEKN